MLAFTGAASCAACGRGVLERPGHFSFAAVSAICRTFLVYLTVLFVYIPAGMLQHHVRVRLVMIFYILYILSDCMIARRFTRYVRYPEPTRLTRFWCTVLKNVKMLYDLFPIEATRTYVLNGMGL